MTAAVEFEATVELLEDDVELLEGDVEFDEVEFPAPVASRTVRKT